jgi:hypothetical protein
MTTMAVATDAETTTETVKHTPNTTPDKCNALLMEPVARALLAGGANPAARFHIIHDILRIEKRWVCRFMCVHEISLSVHVCASVCDEFHSARCVNCAMGNSERGQLTCKRVNTQWTPLHTGIPDEQARERT